MARPIVRSAKKLLKSVHIYRSYRQNKPGGPFFLDHMVYLNISNTAPYKITYTLSKLQCISNMIKITNNCWQSIYALLTCFYYHCALLHHVQKKIGTLVFGHNACKCRPIFKILSLTDSQGTAYVLSQRFPLHLNYVTTLPVKFERNTELILLLEKCICFT